MRIDRPAAKQPGDRESLEKLEQDIAKLQRERTTNWTALHPEDAPPPARAVDVPPK
jgi:hypothetical protein